MSGKSQITQEWCLHAQLTITPPRSVENVSSSVTQQGDGVRMEYTWSNLPSSPSPTPSKPMYGFQRGNIFFTSTPPSFNTNQSRPTESGYSSEHVSASGSYGSLPSRRATQLYNRRCKSTCSITLSGISKDNFPLHQSEHSHCDSKSNLGRSSSLNSPKDKNANENWDETEQKEGGMRGRRRSTGDYSPLLEVCEVCQGGRSPTSVRRCMETNNFTTHFCTQITEKTCCKPPIGEKPETKLSKDVASQTLDSEISHEVLAKPVQPKMGSRVTSGDKNGAAQQPLLQVPSEDTKTKKGLSRSPARVRGQSPLLQRKSPSNDAQKKKPRTVHIDVYCTGSEDADASSSSDSGTEAFSRDSLSSPKTVFESEKLRVIHKKAGKNELPNALQKSYKERSSTCRKSESLKYSSSSSVCKHDSFSRGYDSEDGLSSLYPSPMSSYSTIGRCDSSAVTSTVRDSSNTAISSSSYDLFDGEYDSALASSWKDTTIDSFMRSGLSLVQSDSFEYADTEDKLRIRRKEKSWAEGSTKSWRSPSSERKYLLQQKHKEFLEKYLKKSSFPHWKQKSSEDSDDDDETGDAWSFGGGDDSSPNVCSLKREDTVKRSQPSKLESGNLSDSCTVTCPRTVNRIRIGPFGYKSPTPPPKKMESKVVCPFTDIVGRQTDQLSKAEKFGTTVSAFKKPGHHIGPSKNPDCLCEHCRKFYETKRNTNHGYSIKKCSSVKKSGSRNCSIKEAVQNSNADKCCNTSDLGSTDEESTVMENNSNSTNPQFSRDEV